MLFGLYVYFRSIAVLEFLYMGCKMYFRAKIFLEGPQQSVVSVKKHYSDRSILDSTDGASFPTMLSHPCLQILGRRPFSHHIFKDECLTTHRVGAALYTSYLSILGTLYHPSSQSVKRIYPPPPVYCTALSGFSAGVVQYVLNVLILYLPQNLESCNTPCQCLLLSHISGLRIFL